MSMTRGAILTPLFMSDYKLGTKARAAYASPPTTDRRRASSWMTTTMMTTNESGIQNR